MMNPDDEKMLLELLHWHVEHDPDGARFSPQPFEQMLARGRDLTDKQRGWAQGLLARVTDTPTYENLVSSGRVPRGREVPTPEVLQRLPMKPPGRA